MSYADIMTSEHGTIHADPMRADLYVIRGGRQWRRTSALVTVACSHANLGRRVLCVTYGIRQCAWFTGLVDKCAIRFNGLQTWRDLVEVRTADSIAKEGSKALEGVDVLCIDDFESHRPEFYMAVFGLLIQDRAPVARVAAVRLYRGTYSPVNIGLYQRRVANRCFNAAGGRLMKPQRQRQ